VSDLSITAGAFEFRARWEREGAPRTCAAFEALLPFRQKIIHVRWSGECGGTCFASIVGQLAGNHFLTITEGREQLRELGRTVLWEGAQDVVFETA
jgi:hypothetical protein